MAKYRSLLKNILIRKAGKRRKCHHNKKHIILMGEIVLEIKDGIRSPDGYCSQCAKQMINECKGAIEELEKKL